MTSPAREPSRLGRYVMSRGRRMFVIGLALTIVTVTAVLGYGASFLLSFNAIHRSDALGPATGGKDLDILLMGLDSRLDENGKPLPDKLYKAMHTGDESIGGMNSNVLMYVHVPADGSRAVAISIPRDDYVELVGVPCREVVCHGKIKEAYSQAYAAENRRLAKLGRSGPVTHQEARDAGRRAAVQTVAKFLDVPIDHFVEVTMVAFFQIAQVVAPITVCLKQDTVDTYSGANFKAGVQRISAEQAIAFVRQRRDTAHPGLNFNDLDRSRRQQAFIVSLLTQLKQGSTLTDLGKLQGIIDVAKQNTAIDAGLDAFTLARLAATIDGGNLRFYTLPVEKFGTDERGSSINVVDLERIRGIVRGLLQPPTPTPSAILTESGTGPTSPPPTQTKVPSPAGTVEATAARGPAANALSELTGAGVPCVK